MNRKWLWWLMVRLSVLGVLLMALNFSHGAVQWLAADAAGASYNVTGLGFQPKALRFYWQGLGSSTDTTSGTTFSKRGVGFAVSAGERRCVGSEDQDAAATMVCTTGSQTDCVAMTLTSTPAVDGKLDLESLNADGFRLIVDDQAPVNVSVFWEAWGGSDIRNASTGEVTEPAAAGAVNYVVSGNFTPSVLMLAGVQATATPSASRNDSGLCVGFAAGVSANNTANNIVVVGNSDDASTTADTDGYCFTGQCLAMITVAGGNPNARAGLNQWNEDGFQLGWLSRATTDRRNIYLAIQGGQWGAGDYTIQGQTLGATANVSGLQYRPLGLSLLGAVRAKSTDATSTVHDVLLLGSGASPTSRRSQGHWSEDNSSTGSSVAEVDLIIEYDQVLAGPSAAGTSRNAFDIDAINSDGFRIITDLAGGSANQWQGYLTFGTSNMPPTILMPPKGITL